MLLKKYTDMPGDKSSKKSGRPLAEKMEYLHLFPTGQQNLETEKVLVGGENMKMVEVQLKGDLLIIGKDPLYTVNL